MAAWAGLAALTLAAIPGAEALDFQSSRTLSLAQGGRGGALLTDTVTLNPSMLGFQQAAGLSGTLNWLADAQSVAGADTRSFNVAVIDGKNPHVSAGLSFTRRPDLDFFHLGLAKRVSNGFSVGASGKRFSSRSNALAAAGSAVSGMDGGLSMSFAMPASFLFVPLQIGITADNLRHKKEDERHVGPRQFGIGVKANLSQLLMLYGDVVENFSHFSGAYATVGGGAEIAVTTDFFVRGGLFGYRERAWGAGAGWIGPKIGLSYGYQKRLVEAERSYQHSLTMDIYM